MKNISLILSISSLVISILILILFVVFLFNYSSPKEEKNDSIPTLSGGGTGESCPGIPSFIYKGQTYNTVLIGSQCWMKENLNYAIGESWCYNNNPANCKIYGRLYNWATIMNGEASSNSVPSGVQGICPDGWHLPSDREWYILVDYLDGSKVAGGKLKQTGTAHWRSPNEGADNSSGFAALPGGLCYYDGNFNYLELGGFFWSSSENNATLSWLRLLSYDDENVGRNGFYKGNGFSVRCLKD